METQPTGIFESDRKFIGWASMILLLLGLVSLLLVLICQYSSPPSGFCSTTWIPLFGGQLFQQALAPIRLPLAMSMLILGIGLRLPTGFGWATCLVILGLLTCFFSYLGSILFSGLDEYYAKIATNQIFPQDYPVVESIYVNIGLASLCVIGMVYLLLPSVRKLYWQS